MDHILRCHEIVKTDFVRAENCYLFDSEGRRYVDFESGIWCTALGHGHPSVKAAMQEQIERVVHLGTLYPTQLAEKAALAVLDVIGFGAGKCTFLSAGSEAVEFSVQIAKMMHPDSLMLKFASSFLGSYGIARSKAPDTWHMVDWFECEADLVTCLEAIPFERIGAFVFEPGGSSPGFLHFPPQAVVESIAARLRAMGGLVVANEVTTGMGRTGRWFGFQHYDIQPDIVALGKGLGNGYPVSAVAMRPDVAAYLESNGFHYAQSHQNDPLGCTVAYETIAVMRNEGWIERGRRIGALFLDGLLQLTARQPLAKEARGRGLLLGLELHPSVSAEAVYRQLLADGYVVGYYPAANLLRFDPALTIEQEHINGLLASLDQIISRLVSATSVG